MLQKETFIERSHITQIFYQTLIQAVAKNQIETVRGVTPADAELLHALSSAAATLTSADITERREAWLKIVSVAQLGADLTNSDTATNTPVTGSTSVKSGTVVADNLSTV